MKKMQKPIQGRIYQFKNLGSIWGTNEKSFTKTHAYDGPEMTEYGWAVATVSAG